MTSSSRLEFLGQLAGGLAHEIKNPLSTIKLTLQLLKEDLDDESESKVAKRGGRKLELLLKEVQHLDDIVQEFLAFARGHDVKPTRTNLRKLIVELFEFLEDDAVNRNIQLHFGL